MPVSQWGVGAIWRLRIEKGAFRDQATRLWQKRQFGMRVFVERVAVKGSIVTTLSAATISSIVERLHDFW